LDLASVETRFRPTSCAHFERIQTTNEEVLEIFTGHREGIGFKIDCDLGKGQAEDWRLIRYIERVRYDDKNQ
jgi:hypothetical protein